MPRSNVKKGAAGLAVTRSDRVLKAARAQRKAGFGAYAVGRSWEQVHNGDGPEAGAACADHDSAGFDCGVARHLGTYLFEDTLGYAQGPKKL